MTTTIAAEAAATQHPTTRACPVPRPGGDYATAARETAWPDAPVVVMQAPANVPPIVLAELATDDLRTAMYAPSPGKNGKAVLSGDILEALGKRHDVTGRPRNSTAQAELVPLWLTAHQTRRLIVAPTQRVHPDDLLDLVDLTQATATQIVLGCDHGFVDTVMHAVRSADPVQIAWPSNLPNTLDPTHGTTPGHPAGSRLWPGVDSGNQIGKAHRWGAPTTIPTVEYWTFYATARRLLTPEQFAPVHDLYTSVHARLTTWLHDIDHANNLTADLAHDSLKTIVEEQDSIDAVTTAIRAAQAAYHQAGWYLAVDERELRNGLVRFPRANTDPTTYDLLRGYYEPLRAATVALYLAGATCTQIRNTTIGDLAAWHADHTRPVAGITVHERAHPYLRAALLARTLEGPTHTDPAFPGAERRVRLDIRQAATDLGIHIGDANLDETTPIGARRVPRRVIKLERLT